MSTLHQDEERAAGGMDIKKVPNERLMEILDPPPPEPVDTRDEEVNHLRRQVDQFHKTVYDMVGKLAAVSELTVRQQKKIDELEGRVNRMAPPSSQS